MDTTLAATLRLLLPLFLMAGCAAPSRRSVDGSPPREYCFSPGGDDAHGDGTRARPFRTIDRANALQLNPGDRLLFAAGATFTGNLSLDADDAGTPDRPVVIGSYDPGNAGPAPARATIDAGEGTAVRVVGAGGVVVENLRLRGAGRTANLGSGVHFLNPAHGRSTARLAFVRIRDVEARGFGHEGIHVQAVGNAGFTDVRIERCLAADNARGGIYLEGGAAPAGGAPHPHADVTLSHCDARDNTGDPDALDASDHHRYGSGILVTGVDRAIVESCAASGNGRLGRARNGGPIGIWASDADRVVIQMCEASANHTAGRYDGGGFALDGGVTNSVLQYNYSHDNDGSGFGLFQYPGADPWHDNTVRYNISVNDGRRNGYAGIHVWNGNTDPAGLRRAWIYHNTVSVSAASVGNEPADPRAPGHLRALGREGSNLRQPVALWVQSATSDLRVMNNIFVTSPGLPLIDIEPGQLRAALAGNCYWSGGRDLAYEQPQGGRSTNPTFVSTGSGPAQFRLAAGSPLIDAAVNLPVDTGGRDFAGTPLPQGRAPDVGAWETPFAHR